MSRDPLANKLLAGKKKNKREGEDSQIACGENIKEQRTAEI